MSKIRYYMDEHVSIAIIRGLRQRGVDVLSVPDAKRLGAADHEHLSFAMSQQRVIFTQDTDFLILARINLNHFGIVYARQHTAIGEIIRGLMLIHDVLEAEEMIGKIEYL